MLKTLYFDNRQLLLLSTVMILVAGASALISLPRLEDPRIANRNPVIVTLLPGASAERVEALVTKKIEEELRSVSAIKTIESDSRSGVSLISIELKDEVQNTAAVFSRLRDKLADVESDLPVEASKPDFDDERGAVAYTMIVGIVWNDDSPPPLAVMRRTANEMADRIRNVRGTDLVRLYGEPDEEITITIDPYRLADLRLTVDDVLHRIGSADSKIPAGVLRSSERNMPIEVRGTFETLDRIGKIPLLVNDTGEVTRLEEVAKLTKSSRDPSSEIGLVDGRRSVYVAARMVADARVDQWMRDAGRVIDEMQGYASNELQIRVTFSQGQYTQQRLGELATNLVMGAVVVMLVVFFMMGWRSAILVGLALPLVSSGVLFAMLVLGIPLHQMSIFGLIVALGLLIDNAIVTVDDVGNEMAAGASPREAIARTVNHLFVPLMGSTLTTVIAFLPVFLLPGSLGEFVGPIATTVILALIISLFVSMTIIAALTGIFGRFGGQATWWRQGISAGRLSGWLRGAIRFSVRHPAAGIAFAIALPVIGFLRVGDLRQQFFPSADRNQFHVQVWLPRDASIDRTEQVARAIESEMQRFDPSINSVNWMIGGSIPTVYYNMIMNQDEKPSFAQAVVTTRTDDDVRRIVTPLQSELDARFPEAQIVVKRLGQGPPVEAPVEVRIYGPQIAKLREIGQDLQRLLLRSPDVSHTQTSMDVSEPKLWIEADELQVKLAGLTLSDVASQLQTQLEGSVAGSLLEQTEDLPVRVRMADQRRGDLTAIATSPLTVGGPSNWLPLDAIGRTTMLPQIPSIHRRDGERSNTIRAFVRGEALPPEVTSALMARLKETDYQLPAGYRIEVGGDSEERAEAMGNLFRYAPMLGLLMLSTVVLSFRSFSLAGILGIVAAMSAGLAFATLWVAGFPLGFNPLIGMAGLIGIALNDSIVVLSQIRTSAAARGGDVDAIADEVMKTTRHVFSTTLTTIGGFVPLLLSGGDFWPPLAIVIAGGVGGASILALGFVPAAYRLTLR